MAMDAGVRVWYGIKLDYDDIPESLYEDDEWPYGEWELDVEVPSKWNPDRVAKATIETFVPSAESDVVGIGYALFTKDWDYEPWPLIEMVQAKVGLTDAVVIAVLAKLNELGFDTTHANTYVHTYLS